MGGGTLKDGVFQRDSNFPIIFSQNLFDGIVPPFFIHNPYIRGDTGGGTPTHRGK